MANHIKRGLGPLTCPNARVLILGSLPGDQSIRQQQYYAHPQNHFWRLLAKIFDEPTCASYDDKRALLAQHYIALWDVLHSAERDGSLDSAIQNPVPNDIASFLKRHRAISAIAINGTTAGKLFEKHIARDLVAAGLVTRTAVLPSTSPANTRAFDEKVALWRVFIKRT